MIFKWLLSLAIIVVIIRTVHYRKALIFLEMAEYMKKVAKDSETELSVEERNLLSVAYKNVIGARRAAWRILSSLESRADKNKETIVKYKENIEKELTKICNEILEVLKDVLIPKSTTEESKVFFYKM